MTLKFKALIPFMYGSSVYNPSGEIYEYQEDMVRIWEVEKIVEICEVPVLNKKEVETEENSAQTSQIDVPEDLGELSYKELQNIAKALNLKYTGVKAKDLVQSIKEVR